MPGRRRRRIRRLKKYTPTRFKASDSTYDKTTADYAVSFIQALCHTKGTWAGKPFELIDWQEQIIRDIFGTIKPNGYRQFNTAYVEIPKKMGKSELAAAVALLLTCGDGEERAEVYGCAADRNQASIVFNVAADMVRYCPALAKRVKILDSMKRLIFIRTDPAGNIKADKEKSTEKIDGAVATIMALDRAIRCGNDTGESVYDKRGLLIW